MNFRVRGFTLLEMSIVLLILASLMAGGAMMFSASIQKAQTDETNKKMAAIQKALLNFRLAYNRLPCPAISYLAIENPTFGMEAGGVTAPGNCDVPSTYSNSIYVGSTIGSTHLTFNSGYLHSYAAGAGIDSTTSDSVINIPGAIIVSVDSATTATISMPATRSGTSLLIAYYASGGGVPTKTLNLPDDYSFDGWGRRFSYFVKTGATGTNFFSFIPVTDQSPGLTVVSSLSGGQTKTNSALYVLISHGPNGAGATPRVGGMTTLPNSSNADEVANALSNYAYSGSGQPPPLVQKDPTVDTTNPSNNFDDIVVYGTRQSLRSLTE